MRKRYSLGLGQQLHDLLVQQAHLDGRHVQDQVVYLVEVMLAIAKQEGSKFRLQPEHPEVQRPNLAIKLELRPELEDQLHKMSEDFGLRMQHFVRALLWMGLELEEKYAPKGQCLRKEDFVSLMLTSINR